MIPTSHSSWNSKSQSSFSRRNINQRACINSYKRKKNKGKKNMPNNSITLNNSSSSTCKKFYCRNNRKQSKKRWWKDNKNNKFNNKLKCYSNNKIINSKCKCSQVKVIFKNKNCWKLFKCSSSSKINSLILFTNQISWQIWNKSRRTNSICWSSSWRKILRFISSLWIIISEWSLLCVFYIFS